MNSRFLAALFASSAALAFFGSQAAAQTVLFSDNFNRSDNRNIQAEQTGIVNNTGDSLLAGAPGTVYVQPWLDPNNAYPTYGIQDGSATNGGGAAIVSSQLELALGSGTANAYVNHNFTDGSILAAGGFTISLDVTGYAGTAIGQGGAFAIGMSAAEAASAGDAFGDTQPSMTRAFHDTGVAATGSTIGNDISAVGSQPVVSDFWLALRGNKTLVWGGNSGIIYGVTGLPAKTGTISATFTFSDFNAGSTVDYVVFYNGLAVGTNSFTWSGTDDNYIGLDSRDGTGGTMDNFTITTVPEPSAIALLFLGTAGHFIRRRKF
jgi:PEP-CTERM motif